MLDWIIDKLNRLNRDITCRKYKKYCKKREEKMNLALTDLWRESAIHKTSVRDLGYVQKQLERENKEYVWIVEYHEKYLPK